MTVIDIRNPALWYRGGILYSHYSECDLDDYPNFSFAGDPRLYDRITKAFFFHAVSMHNLQAARYDYGLPMDISSGHRGPRLNALVGGEPRSCHKFVAFDIRLNWREKDNFRMAHALVAAGFNGIGFYNTFIHVDMGRPRFWFGSRLAKEKWLKFALANITPITTEQRVKELWKN